MLHLPHPINTLTAFCGMRDIPALTQEALLSRIGSPQVDVAVLFGGSILAGGDCFAEAMRNRIAKTYVIVGGAGHTTQTLRDLAHAELPALDTADRPEAEVFDGYLRLKYGLRADHLECESTNCGNNITHLLDLLRKRGIPCESILLMQDATMMRRMDAGLRKFRPDLTILNYATYRAEVVEQNGALAYAHPIHGMWDIPRYVELLLGEIPRLSPDGYGPQGKGFIAHVDIPADVLAAYETLRQHYTVRIADPRYASK